MLELNDLLEKAGIEPKDVLIMRHRPTEPGLRRVLPWYAAEKPALFNAYQRAQASKRAEAAMMRCRYLAAFIGIEPGYAQFAGFYRQDGYREITSEEYAEIAENIVLQEQGMSMASQRPLALWFDLVLEDTFSDLQGRLAITWSGLERAWYRWADRNVFPIATITETSRFAQEMSEWQELVLNWAELNNLPRSWRAALSEWRGIYLITDQADGKAYVGSAYGRDNIFGRWQSYAQSGHGGNIKLKNRNPQDFAFSILQRVSPDMEPEDVVRLEASWKKRLLTRTLGLNAN